MNRPPVWKNTPPPPITGTCALPLDDVTMMEGQSWASPDRLVALIGKPLSVSCRAVMPEAGGKNR